MTGSARRTQDGINVPAILAAVVLTTARSCCSMFSVDDRSSAASPTEAVHRLAETGMTVPMATTNT